MFPLKVTLLTAVVILVLVSFSSCDQKKSTKDKPSVNHTNHSSQQKTSKKSVKNAVVTKAKSSVSHTNHTSQHKTPKKTVKNVVITKAKTLANHTSEHTTPKKHAVKNERTKEAKPSVSHTNHTSQHKTPKKTVNNVVITKGKTLANHTSEHTTPKKHAVKNERTKEAKPSVSHTNHTSHHKTPKKTVKNVVIIKDKPSINHKSKQNTSKRKVKHAHMNKDKPLVNHKSQHKTLKKTIEKVSLIEVFPDKPLVKSTSEHKTPKKTIKDVRMKKAKPLVKQTPKHTHKTPKKTIKNARLNKDKARKTKTVKKSPPQYHVYSVDDEFGDESGSGSGSGEVNKCSKPLDLVVALDSSESIREANWTRLMRFTKALAESLDPSLTRIAIIRYNTNAEVPVPLGFFQSSEAFSSTLDGVFYEPGGTRTDVALSKALAVFASGGQRRASRVLLVITDNPTNDIRISKENLIVGKDLVEKPSENLKSYEVITFAVGIKYGLTSAEREDLNQEFKMITQDEDGDKRIVEVEDFDELLAMTNKVAGKICLVNGGWTSWTQWSECTASCGGGTKVRLRSCENPKPMNNGTNCTQLGGSSVETKTCNIYPCTEGIEMTTLYPQSSARPSAQNILFSKDCPNGFDFVYVDNNQMSASSVYTRNTGDATIMKNHAPSNGKLYNVMNAGSWCAEHSQSVSNCQDQFIQIDLKLPIKIAKLGTQGQASVESRNWVTFYKFNYSEDGRTWKQYKTLLTANSDRENVKENNIIPPVKARYVRFNPIHWNSSGGRNVHDICMRVGVYTCTEMKKTEQHHNKVKQSRKQRRRP